MYGFTISALRCTSEYEKIGSVFKPQQSGTTKTLLRTDIRHFACYNIVVLSQHHRHFIPADLLLLRSSTSITYSHAGGYVQGQPPPSHLHLCVPYCAMLDQFISSQLFYQSGCVNNRLS